MIMLITGLPGVGKGTQAELISKKYQIKHLSTGDLFRSLMMEKNDLAKELKSYLNEGKLVPDRLTIKILKQEIAKEEYKNGFLLDGFPRTVEQAKFLDNLLLQENLQIDYIINLYLDEEEIKKRLSGRWFCLECKKTYQEISNPPKTSGECDNCGEVLIQRDDDKPEKVKVRLEVAKEQTLPVIDYYGKKVKTIDVNNKNIEEVFSEIKEVIK